MIRKDIIDLFRVRPARMAAEGSQPGLEAIGGVRGLRQGRAEGTGEGVLEQNLADLAEAQNLLYADDRYAVLIVLQAMDAAGKDGTIKHVMSGVNPQGCQVFSFKKPSAEDLDHNFLWRYMKCLPERGRIGIFNRSYYEDVLVVKVHPELHRPAAAAREGEVRQEVLGGALRGHQRLRAAPRPQRHADPQVLPERVEGRAEAAVPGAARPAGEELEVLPVGPGRARLLGRLHGGLRGRPGGHEHRVGPVVRDPGGPQVGHPRGRRRHRDDRDPGARPQVPRSDGRATEALARPGRSSSAE